MAALTEIIAELDAFLGADAYSDYGPNGLQVPGRQDVQTVVTGVSAHLELFERALAEGADLILTHHGILWDRDPRAISEQMARRLRLLLENEVSLASYHLPLDGHPEIGNNALIADGIGCDRHDPFGATVGRVGRFGGEGISIDELVGRVRDLTGREPLVFAEGPERIRSVAIVSGNGNDYMAEAAQRGIDAFVTGEPTERVMAVARESGMHFVAAGHYATETFGVRALGDRLADRFGVRHTFIEVPNPI